MLRKFIVFVGVLGSFSSLFPSLANSPITDTHDYFNRYEHMVKAHHELRTVLQEMVITEQKRVLKLEDLCTTLENEHNKASIAWITKSLAKGNNEQRVLLLTLLTRTLNTIKEESSTNIPLVYRDLDQFLDLVVSEKSKFLHDPCNYTPTEIITVGNYSAHLHHFELESKPLQHALKIQYVIGEQRHHEQVNGGSCRGSHDASNHTLTLASYAKPVDSTSASSIIPEPRYPHVYYPTLASKSDVSRDYSDSASSIIPE
jgi:hypothetical protein